MIDKFGNTVIESIYEKIYPFNQYIAGWVTVIIDSYLGCDDTKGKEVVPCKHEGIGA